MTETPEQNRKRLEYEIGATVIPNGDFKWGYSYWPDFRIAVSFWDASTANILNSRGRQIARFKFESWIENEAI